MPDTRTLARAFLRLDLFERVGWLEGACAYYEQGGDTACLAAVRTARGPHSDALWRREQGRRGLDPARELLRKLADDYTGPPAGPTELWGLAVAELYTQGLWMPRHESASTFAAAPQAPRAPIDRARVMPLRARILDDFGHTGWPATIDELLGLA